MKSAVILCSGGLDSVVTAYYLKNKLRYRKIIILFFNYGQRTLKQEQASAKRCASLLKAKFIEMRIDEISKLSLSLINIKGRAKHLSRKDLKNTKAESDKWYVPCRNIIFLSYALALVESLYIKYHDVYDIAVGFKNEGREGFPDASKEFVAEFNIISRTACKKDFKIITPLIKRDKEDIVLLGESLGVKFEETFSCYSGEGGEKHCGYCLACRLRQEGFYWADVPDPTNYRIKMKDFRKA